MVARKLKVKVELYRIFLNGIGEQILSTIWAYFPFLSLPFLKNLLSFQLLCIYGIYLKFFEKQEGWISNEYK